MSSTSVNVLSNMFFNEQYYLTQKTDALNAQATNGQHWTTEGTADAIENAGMTVWQHFANYGAYETNANGELGIDPSAFFSVSAYYDALANAEHVANVRDVLSEVREAGDPIAHYATTGYAMNLDAAPVYDKVLVPFASRFELFSQFYFDEGEYLANKAAALNAEHYQGKVWSAEDVAAAIENVHMTTWQHFANFGAFETSADGTIGIDPSQNFDVSRYYADKAEILGVTPEETMTSFHAAHIDPLTHYSYYGVAEQLTPRATSLDTVYISEDTNVPPRSGNSLIDSILIREADWPSLNRVAAKDGIVRYHYLTDSEIAANPEDEHDDLKQLTSAQREGYEQGLSVLTKITGVQFEESTNVDSANLLFATAFLEADTSGVTGGAKGWGEEALTVLLNNDYTTNQENTNPVFGKEGFETVCHELGHAMGLEHPFTDETEADGLQHCTLPGQIDTTAMSIMSYTRADTTQNPNGEAVAPWCVDGTYYYSPADILALQYLYGTDGINGQEGIVYDTTVLA